MTKLLSSITGIFFLLIQLINYSPALACSIHDHGCRYHGAGLQVLPGGINGTLNGADGLVGVLGWDGTNDLDIHGLLPDGNGAYSATGSGRTGSSTPGGDSNGNLRANEPFIGAGEHNRHIYYSQYDLDFQNGNAAAYISGDVSGGSANPHAACTVAGTESCESIGIVGSNLPLGVPFTFQAYNFNDKDASANPSTDFSLRAYATGRYIIVNKTHVDAGVQGTLANTGDSSAQLEVILGQLGSDPHAIGTQLANTGRQPNNATARQLQMFKTITAQDVQIIAARRRERARLERLAEQRRRLRLTRAAETRRLAASRVIIQAEPQPNISVALIGVQAGVFQGANPLFETAHANSTISISPEIGVYQAAPYTRNEIAGTNLSTIIDDKGRVFWYADENATFGEIAKVNFKNLQGEVVELNNAYKVTTRVGGTVQVVAGGFEMFGGAAACSTGAGCLAGAPVAIHGADDMQAGLRTVWTGENTYTLTADGVGWVAEKVGASPQQVETVKFSTEIGTGIVSGGFGFIKSVRYTDAGFGILKSTDDFVKGGTYKLRDPITNQVCRTGRTCNIDNRKAQHARNPDTKDLDFEVDIRTDDYAKQRGREQIIHDQHPEALHSQHPEYKGGEGGLNKVRAIRPNHPDRKKYLNAAENIE